MITQTRLLLVSLLFALFALSPSSVWSELPDELQGEAGIVLLGSPPEEVISLEPTTSSETWLGGFRGRWCRKCLTV